MSTIVGAHQKTWRAARVMALESGAAPSAPMWHPAPRVAAACSSRWWRLRPVPQPQAGPVSPPSCGRRAASRAHGQPPGAGLGRRPEAWGTAGYGEALAGMPREKGLYSSYTHRYVHGFPRIEARFARMIRQLKAPYQQATLPDVVSAEELWGHIAL